MDMQVLRALITAEVSSIEGLQHHVHRECMFVLNAIQGDDRMLSHGVYF